MSKEKKKGCQWCRHYRQYYCGLSGPEIKVPTRIINNQKKCPSIKKIKRKWRLL